MRNSECGVRNEPGTWWAGVAMAVLLLVYLGGYGVFRARHDQLRWMTRGNHTVYFFPDRPASHVFARLYGPLLSLSNESIFFGTF